MQIYEQIFTKEKMIQCQFYDTSFHPDYLGAEYQAGYELITALTYDREYTSSMLSKLVRSYIEYLENPTDKKRSSYEKIIYDIDDYCIYLHELSIVIITLIKDVHPNYLLSNRRMVAHHFSVNAVKEMLNEQENIKEEKKTLSEEQLLSLNDTLLSLETGMMIKVKYYNVYLCKNLLLKDFVYG